MMNRTILLLVVAFLSIYCESPSAQGQPPQADDFQKMFDLFSSQANRAMPGVMGEMSPEQKAKLDAVKISTQEESQGGKKLLDNILAELKKGNVKVRTDGKDVQYVKQLVKLISPLMTQVERYNAIDVRVVESERTDAFALMGGHLLFTSGLLDNAESEAALVGVVAHELAHLDRGHLLVPLKLSKLTQQPSSLKDGMTWLPLVAKPFRPEQESEADHDAVRWMMELGYDFKELSKLLARWDEREAKQTPWMNFVPGFVKTHPDPGKRSREVADWGSQLAPQFPMADFIGKENLARRQSRPSNRNGR